MYIVTYIQGVGIIKLDRRRLESVQAQLNPINALVSFEKRQSAPFTSRF